MFGAAGSNATLAMVSKEVVDPVGFFYFEVASL
jgi:hypothetical protein